MDSQFIEIFSIQHLSDHFKMQIDGVIGFELLSRYVVRTDLDEMKMFFYDASSYQYLNQRKQMSIIDLEHHHFGLPLTLKPKKSHHRLPYHSRLTPDFPAM